MEELGKTPGLFSYGIDYTQQSFITILRGEGGGGGSGWSFQMGSGAIMILPHI